MKVRVEDLYVGALIQADFLCSYREHTWHEVFAIDKKGDKVYIEVEGYKGITLPNDYEVELK